MTNPSAATSGETEGAFPWSLAEEVFTLIRARGIRVIRYADLAPSRFRNPSRFRYIDEYVRFRAGRFTPLAAMKSVLHLLYFRLGATLPFYNHVVERAARGAAPPTLILQHDADLMPERTLQMLALEERFDLRSSCYVFAEHAQASDYELDIPALKGFEERGFEIGYHQNAYERSGFDLQKAERLVREDMAFLRSHFDIRSFVPHGGIPSPGGLNNHDLPHVAPLQDLLWAYNGKCILKEYTWSDGGIRKWDKADPRAFVESLANGTRAVMLMHPQYYSDALRDDWRELPVARQRWWRELWGL